MINIRFMFPLKEFVESNLLKVLLEYLKFLQSVFNEHLVPHIKIIIVFVKKK